MPRHIKVGAAQMGPNNEGIGREEIVERMLALLERAVEEDVQLIAYPEMALTTYFRLVSQKCQGSGRSAQLW